MKFLLGVIFSVLAALGFVVLLAMGIYTDFTFKAHSYDVYQGGIKIDEICRMASGNFTESGSYYKMVKRECK